MSKTIRLTLVAALAATVSGCDVTETSEAKPAQRDVYTSLEDCVADWGDQELCERQIKEGREHLEKMAQAKAASGGGSGGIMPIFMGPTYYGNDRYYRDSRGDLFHPNTQRARQTVGWNPQSRSISTLSKSAAPVFRGTPSPATTGLSAAGTSRGFSTSSVSSSSSAARGGFGGTGASVSSSGGG